MLDNHTFAYLISALLIGSIPTGFIAARLRGGKNIFPAGEFSPMNSGEVFRILGRGLGILVTFLDFLKGFVTVSFLVTFFLGPEGHLDWRIVSAGAALVVLAHVSSPWLGFRGGRGFATSYGVLLYVLPVPAVLAGLVWFSLSFWGLSTRPGTLSSASAMPLFSIAWVLMFDYGNLFYLYLVAFLSLLIMFQYRGALKNYMGWKDPTPTPAGAD